MYRPYDSKMNYESAMAARGNAVLRITEGFPLSYGSEQNQTDTEDVWDSLANESGGQKGSDLEGSSSLSRVVLVRSHRPEPLVVARGKCAIGLRRIAVDERPQIHRVSGAAHLVLDSEQVPAV